MNDSLEQEFPPKQQNLFGKFFMSSLMVLNFLARLGIQPGSEFRIQRDQIGLFWRQFVLKKVA